LETFNAWTGSIGSEASSMMHTCIVVKIGGSKERKFIENRGEIYKCCGNSRTLLPWL